MAAILMFGYPVWQPIVDRYYDMESKKSDQSYDLQLKTFELIEGKVMAKLEDMQEDITALKEDFSDMR
jgi:molybdopterin-biosynthesis enzyme MoeA-like protein